MTELNSEELFHLGLHALGEDDVEKSLVLFKRCVDKDASHVKATYMVGALYAQIQMMDRAVEWMQRAIELDSSEKTAVFQLGLVYLTSGEIEKARSIWVDLQELQSEHSFRLFSEGMLALVEDDFAQCVAKLELGIANNDFNAPLNNDMRRVIESAAAARESQELAVEGNLTVGSPSLSGTHIALSGYKKSLKKQ